MEITKKSNHYVSNKDLLNRLIEYKNACKQAELEKKPKPKIPEEIGYTFLRIAQNVANKRNYAMYSYKDDMIGNAVENCIMYMDRFDENKSSNPFSYFTQIIINAFKRTINNEGKESYVKYKSLESSPQYFEDLSNSGIKNDVNPAKNVINDHTNSVISKFEDRIKRQKVKRILKKFSLEV